MTLQDGPPLFIPPMFQSISAGGTYATINTAGYYFALVVAQAPSDITIRDVAWMTGTTTTGGDLDVRIETVDPATGIPTGTLWAANTEVAFALAATDDNVIKTATLTADAVISQGSAFAVVLRNAAATPNWQIRRSNVTAIAVGTVYGIRYAGSPVKNVDAPQIGVREPDGTWPWLGGGFLGATTYTQSININSTPDEVGNLFSLPWPVRVIGAWTKQGLAPADLVLYDDSDVVLGSSTVSPNISSGNDTSLAFFAPVELAAGTQYRLVSRPSTTTNVSIYRWPASEAAGLEQIIGQAGSWQRTQRTNAGAWSQTATELMQLGLIVDAFSDGAGGGGSSPFAYGWA